MPRKPRRSGQLAPRLFSFSPFSRSVSRAAAAYSLVNKVSSSKFHRKSSSNFVANRTSHDSRENDPSSDTSEDETLEVSSSEEETVETLLANYLDDKQWDISGFVDIIIAQTTVGSVVRIVDDEDEGLFAFLTALNLRRYKDHKCIAELKDYLLEVCSEEDPVGKLKVLLGDQAEHVGLIVSQRVANFPPQLLPHLYDALFDEISWATEDELKNYRIMGLVMAVTADKAPLL